MSAVKYSTVLMDLPLHLTVIIIVTLANIQQHGGSARSKRRLLDFRKMAKVFVRYNVKVNVVPYTSTFAFAMGFRANWDIKPSTVVHPKRRTALVNQLIPNLYDPNKNRPYSIVQQHSNQSLYLNNMNQTSLYPYSRYLNSQQYRNNMYTYSQYPNDRYTSNRYYQYQQFHQPHSYYQRAIHSAVQSAFDWHGLNGSACLQRTVCEVSDIHQDDIISQIFKIIFNGTEEFDCPEDIQCPVSLLQLVEHILTNTKPDIPN